MSSSIDSLQLRKIMGRDFWNPPQPYGPDGWFLTARDKSGSVIVSVAPHGNAEWIHASIAWTDHTPTYEDLVKLHKAVFRDGYAYQVFAPSAEHVNIHAYALHLWGRLDGQPGLPVFVTGSTI